MKFIITQKSTHFWNNNHTCESCFLQVLLLRYSRTRPGPPYLPSTAVMLNECCKFTVCIISLLAQQNFSVRKSWRAFRDEILGKPYETVKLIVPSGLYCLQNNLLFVALTNLDAATYQVS